MPYCDVRYYLQEWVRGSRGPQNAQELSNMWRSKLRNVVERIFGIMIARYMIHTYLRPFQMKAQVRVVAVLCVLYNILNDFDEEEDDTPANTRSAAPAEESAEDDSEHIYNIVGEEISTSIIRHDEIASAKWADCVARRIEDADI